MDEREMELLEMAYTRERYRDAVQSKVAGAFLEHLTACVFEFNRESKWVEHKRVEVTRLLRELEVLQFVEVKGSRELKKAASDAAQALIARKSKGLLTAAINSMDKYFKRSSKAIPIEVSEAWVKDFAQRVQDVIEGFVY